MIKKVEIKFNFYHYARTFMVGLVLTGCQKEESASKVEEKVITIAVAQTIRTTLEQGVTLSGELIPYSKATLYAKVPGYLKKIHVDIGDQVKQGQTLALLDNPELDADVSRNKASYDITSLDYQRINDINTKHPGLLAQEEVDKAKAAYAIAEANYKRAVTFQDYSVIIAPFDGVITKRFVDEGALIQAGTSSSTQAMPVVEIADNTRIRLVFSIPESMVSQTKVGDSVGVTIQSTNQIINAVIARMAGKVDSDTRTMKAEADIDNVTLEMTPGMYASIKLCLERKENILALPIEAIEAGESISVWIVNEKKETHVLK